MSSTPDHSISTDSEESFLMKQLNKSQLFNNSSSSGSINRNRKSLFRESYIDDDGAMRSFSVFQDAINETTDESRDISLTGLSTFSMDRVVHQNTDVNTHHILVDVDGNVSRHDLKPPKSTSRSASLRQHKRPSSAKLATRAADGGSSQYTDSQQDLTSLQNVVPAALPQNFTPAPTIPSPALHSIQRIPTPEYPAPFPPRSLNSDETDCIELQNDLTMEQLKQLIKSQRIPSGSDSSTNTRQSIRMYEETRHKTRGTPRLLQCNSTVVRNAQKVHIKVVPQSAVQEVKSAPGGFAVTRPQERIEAPTSLDSDTEKGKLAGFIEEYTGPNGSNGKPYDGSYVPEDPLLDKIYADRHTGRCYIPRACSSVLFWLVLCLGFILPPLFFLLGLGLLDRAMGQIDHTLKRVSLATGCIWVLVVLGLMGIGFGVGITRE